METQFNIGHAKEILEASGQIGYLLFDERGVWPGIARDLLLLADTEELRWRPARQLQHLPDAPEVNATPMLPNPFNARELAAFMLKGVGASVADFYGDWSDGPDVESLSVIGLDSHARRAVIEAFTAYREAEKIVGPAPVALGADATRARKAYNEAKRAANEREGVFAAMPGTIDAGARRKRAADSIAAQEAEMNATEAASQQASEAWLTAMVQCLLGVEVAQPEAEHAATKEAKRESPSVGRVRDSGASAALPEGLSTSTLAGAFNGIYWDIVHWVKNLNDPPAWLKAEAQMSPGKRGGINPLQRTWNPVLVGRYLMLDCKGWARSNETRFEQRVNMLTERFRSNDDLKLWKALWGAEAAQLLSGD